MMTAENVQRQPDTSFRPWLDTIRDAEGRAALSVRLFRSAMQEGDSCDAPVRLVRIHMTGPQGEERHYAGIPDEEGMLYMPCGDVVFWEPEHPALYDVSTVLETEQGQERKFEQKLGFRFLEIRGRDVLWNDRPLKLKGICYRERREDPEGTRKDLELFAAAHVNFLRAIYGPFSPQLLSMCDEMGIFTENTAPFFGVGTSGPVTQDLPHCREEYIRAGKELVAGGSHVSVLLWSLGHDCAYGANFRLVREEIRRADTVRPILFHFPMSVPEGEPQPEVWPVQYVDWQLPFDVCYDQMEIFHTPGADNEIGYMTAAAPYELPVLHEIWAPVACDNREEIDRDPYIRSFWGESLCRFVQKALITPGCLGGAVLAGVDEDGSMEALRGYEWGVLDREHHPKPEYYALKAAYALGTESENAPESGQDAETGGPAEAAPAPAPEDTDGGPFSVTRVESAQEAELLIENSRFCYRFSLTDGLLKEASADGVCMLSGGPYLLCTGLQYESWNCLGIEAVCDKNAGRDACSVLVTIRGEYPGAARVRFDLVLGSRGTLDTCYEIEALYRHMPHRVKVKFGVSCGGLNEKGIAYVLSCGTSVRMVLPGEEREKASADRFGVAVCADTPGERIILRPFCSASFGNLVDDRDERMHFEGNWRRMDDYCGNFCGTETLSKTAGDSMSLHFAGTGITLYGPTDINGGMCDVYLDGRLLSGRVSRYPEPVDFPGMSRGYEKRYRQIIADADGLEPGLHELKVVVLGEKEPGAQEPYVSIDGAQIRGGEYPAAQLLCVLQDYNYPRFTGGNYRRPRVELIPGEHCRARMVLGTSVSEERRPE